jgi:tRNA pseudouridine38-40 synthase
LKDLDFDKVVRGIELFVGKHDFKNFSKEGSNPKSTIREIYEVKAYKWKKLYILKFRGNSFLRSQVRFMVSALFELAKGEITEKDILEIINKEKTRTFKPAPPHGLYLWRIHFSR